MSANHQINVNEASREDSKKTMPVVAGNDGKGGSMFKGLVEKRSMSEEDAARFKDQLPDDTLGSTLAKMTGFGK